VLARFDPDERPAIQEAIGRAADAAEVFLTDSIDRVMNEYNRKGMDDDNG
jgi:peptidyl-tRNA hydrolase